MRVCVVPCDHDGSGCYRLLFPAAELRSQLGWEVAMPPFTATQLDWVAGRGLVDDGLRRVRFERLHAHVLRLRPDVLVVQRPVDVGLPALFGDVRGRGVRVVVETDDLMEGLPEWNPAFEALRVEFNPARNNRVFRECLGVADGVSCSTPFLASRYGGRVIRNRLFWRMWDLEPVFGWRAWSRPRVGWMGSAKWHMGDLKVLRGLIGPWLVRNPGVDFVAQPDALDFLEVPVGQRVVMGSVAFRDLGLRDITARMDIGLVPLARHDFNEGKSHLKGLEYAACGVPCIASPTESYRWWVEPGVNGYLAAKPRQWLGHLDRMVADMALVRRLGEAAYVKAREHRLDAHIGEWADFFRDVVAGRTRVAA